MVRLSLLALTLFVLAVDMIVTVGFMLRAGEPSKIWWWPLAIGFLIWTLLPYAVFAYLAWRFRARFAPSLTLFVGTLVVSGLSIFSLYDAFVAHLDPQSGLVLLVLPLLQWPAVGLTMGIAMAVDHATQVYRKEGFTWRMLRG